ncbi:hypothetical protein ES288_D04G039600v1 [Gossypium darwinii]|uniref:Uncharacterized protein n=1 Tax=Gossypium darwinii TaxID=34276 RepID=A0A5D2CWQ5_GOSDA|nr:hypothetical protein ES288_D04G039600v1 [Gossypium darwinii]
MNKKKGTEGKTFVPAAMTRGATHLLLMQMESAYWILHLSSEFNQRCSKSLIISLFKDGIQLKILPVFFMVETRRKVDKIVHPKANGKQKTSRPMFKPSTPKLKQKQVNTFDNQAEKT